MREDTPMPHLTLEYSDGLADRESLTTLCRNLARCLQAQRDGERIVYPLGGIRVRAVRCETFCIADGAIDAAFLHANLKIAAGRSDAVKQATGNALFAVIKEHFADAFERQGLALSLEINEFSEAGTWKHNNLHARLKR
jgi:5-carboxymethyl-2-hydroxymuconate isomerase